MNPFIALEGCDGSGKSTVRQLLVRELGSRGIPVVTVGQHSWLDPRYARLIVRLRERRVVAPPAVISEAYAVDKHLHGVHNVGAALTHSWVLADRWVISDAVYHEALYGIPARDTIARHAAMRTRLPDLIVYVSVDADEAYRRVVRRGRHLRHYERPVDLSRIAAIYERVLFGGGDGLVSPCHRFGNDGPDLPERVADELVPYLMSRRPVRRSLHDGADAASLLPS